MIGSDAFTATASAGGDATLDEILTDADRSAI